MSFPSWPILISGLTAGHSNPTHLCDQTAPVKDAWNERCQRIKTRHRFAPLTGSAQAARFRRVSQSEQRKKCFIIYYFPDLYWQLTKETHLMWTSILEIKFHLDIFERNKSSFYLIICRVNIYVVLTLLFKLFISSTGLSSVLIFFLIPIAYFSISGH